MVQLRLDLWDGIPLSGSVAIGPVDAQIDHDIHVESRLVTSRTRAEEVLDTGIGRGDLVVVRRSGLKTSHCDLVPIGAGGRIGCRNI